jgi:signal transduction histidine kinase
MQIKLRTNTIILLGFSLILVILAMMTVIWLTHITTNNQYITDIVKDQKKTKFIFDMREAANQRALSLYRMSILKDPFDQDEEYLKFRNQAEIFIKAHLALAAEGETKQAEAAWREAQPLIKTATKNQTLVTEYIVDGDITSAHKLMTNRVIPNQNAVFSHLTTMLNLQKTHVAGELKKVTSANDRVYFQVSLLGAIAVFIGAIIALFVTKTSTKSEQKLIRAQQESQEANQHKSLFLANMSHELRTPLNAIIGYSEMLQEEAKEFEEESIAADLGKIRESGQHLLGLINDILDVSKIEAGKMEAYTEDFNLAFLVEEVSNTIGPLLSKNENCLQINASEFDENMHTDLTKLRQILFNLLSNANKFTRQGSIYLSASRFMEQNESWIKIAVKDTGIGMNEKQIDRLFAPFTQADASTTRNFGGTGLGLTISKHFCEMMGGTISVESESGVGSTFSICLPIKTTVTSHEIIIGQPTETMA